MKSFAFTLSPIRAVGLAILLVASAGSAQAQSGPFAGFEGSWSGNGTVSLANGANESIRCRATYAPSGNSLKQTLRCASDSYTFNLSSDVTSQGDQVSGNWSESSRGINGSLQGTAGGGQIQVFVEAAGFAANISLTTRGNKQQVSISSKGEIKGVNITLVKG